MAKRKPKTTDGVDLEAVYMCIETHASGAVVGAPIFVAGTRLRGDHPSVQSNPQYFVPDGTTHDEIARRRQALYGGRPAEPIDYTLTQLKEPLRDEDAVVPTGRVPGVGAGERLSKSDERVLDNPDRFTDVVPAGLDRNDALVAMSFMQSDDSDHPERSFRIFQGQWVPREHPAVALHPAQFAVPAPAPR